MAMTSGVLAAEAILDAREAEDFSAAQLDAYRRKLLDGFVGHDLKKYKDATHHFEKYPHYFEKYIPLMNRAASQMFTVDGSSKWEKQKKIWNELGSAKEKWKMARDLMQAWRVMK